MDGSAAQTFLSDLLHVIAQALLAPDILLLLAFIGYALFCIGSIVAECFTERRHFKVAMPKFLAELMAASEDEIPAVIENSGLLKRQKSALLTVYDYRILPGDALVALIKRLVSEEESRYDHITDRNGMAARVSPMLGLMGTLIPLGPGIQALGKADTETLSTSLLVAFDTTVAGLVVAAVCMVIGKIRSNWYANYMSALDSAMATMLQKIEDMRAAGIIQIQEPTNYAFLYEAKVAAQSKSAKNAKKANQGKHGKRGSASAEGAQAEAAQAEGVPGNHVAGMQAGWVDPSAEMAAAAGVYQMNVDGAGVMMDGSGVMQEAVTSIPYTAAPAMQSAAPMENAFAVPEQPLSADGGYFNPYADAGSTADMGAFAIPADAPAPASVVPATEEIAMPSFLDALEAPAPLAEPVSTQGDDPDAVDTASTKSWY